VKDYDQEFGPAKQAAYKAAHAAKATAGGQVSATTAN